MRVLVVDDNADGAAMLARALRLHGYDVRVAHDGADALHVAAEFRPEVALLDIGLPVMDGYELARRLRAMPGAGRHPPDRTDRLRPGERPRKARAPPASIDHLVKPVAVDELEGAMHP